MIDEQKIAAAFKTIGDHIRVKGDSVYIGNVIIATHDAFHAAALAKELQAAIERHSAVYAEIHW